MSNDGIWFTVILTAFFAFMFFLTYHEEHLDLARRTRNLRAEAYARNRGHTTFLYETPDGSFLRRCISPR